MLLACEARKPAATATTEARSAAPNAAAPVPGRRYLAAADTASPFPELSLGAQPDSVQGLSAVRIAGQRCRVETSAQAEPNRRLPVPANAAVPADSAERAEYAAADSVHRACVECGYGYDVAYTVRLLGPDGRPRFTTRLRKADFAAAMGREHVAQSAPDVPRLLAFLPAFNALVLEVGFFLDGTDDGGTALLLLDAATGRVRNILDRYWWGAGQGGDALTPDGRALLTCYRILHADGRQVSLERKSQGWQVSATRLISPTTALVVYDPSGFDNEGNKRPVRGDNAWLVDLNGRPLSKFGLAGLEAEVGYGLRAAYLRPTRTHYLFDYATDALYLIPQDAPLKHRRLTLRQLSAFRPPQRPAEVSIGIRPATETDLRLYVDTLSGAVRYQRSKPAEY